MIKNPLINIISDLASFLIELCYSFLFDVGEFGSQK